MINRRVSRRGFNIFIPREENVNAPVVHFIQVVDHDERSFDSLVRENDRGVFRKYLRSAIELETLNYFRDRRRNHKNIWGHVNVFCMSRASFIEISLSQSFGSRLGGFHGLWYYSEIILWLFVFIFSRAILAGLRKISPFQSFSFSLLLSFSIELNWRMAANVINFVRDTSKFR